MPRTKDPELLSVLEHTVHTFQAFGWQSVILFLNDGTHPYPAAAVGVTALSSSFDADLPDRFYPPTWRQEQFRTNRSYLVGDNLFNDSHSLPEDFKAEWQAASVLVLMLEIDNKEIGWLCLGEPTDCQYPSLDQLRTLEFFASQSALTIQQARRHLEVREQFIRQVILNAIAHTISQNLEMAELFAAITLQLQQMAFGGRASITLREGMRPHARIFVQEVGQQVDGVIQSPGPLEEIAFSQVIQQNQPYRLIPDLSQAALLPAENQLLTQNIRSYVCLPLSVWGQVIGAFSMATPTADFFRSEDIGFLTQIADHVGAGVWNTLLYELEQKRRRAADALAELSKMVNSTLELDQVLELALQQLSALISYDTASILLVEGDNLIITACRGFDDPDKLLGTVFELKEDNISHKVLRSQQVRVVSDVQQLPEWGHKREDIEGFQKIRAWIGAPLVVREQSIGLLVLDKFQANFFTEEDGETAAAFATQIATAIQNARFFRVLQQQRDRLAAILTDTSDAVIVLNNINQIWLLNPAAARTLKINRDNIIGQPVTVLGLPELNAALDKAQRDKQPARIEVSRPDGSAFYASLAPVRDVGWVIVMQDITPLKELDRLRTEWVAAVSHDLKNPIQVIQLGAALLEMDGPLNELQLERIMIIQRGAEQLRSLVTGVLDLARLEAGPALRMAVLNLADVFSASIAEVEHLATKNQQRLVIDTARPLPLLMGDATLLQRALVNLLSNAIKYTPAGGIIRLHTQLSQTQINIEVTDNGPGIPADSLPQIFNRFYRVPGTAAEGTGLGLSIVKSIVEKHGGSIEVKSVQGKGSTFMISLPIPLQDGLT